MIHSLTPRVHSIVADGAQPIDLVSNTPLLYVHAVRDPLEMIVSAYLYHRRGAEAGWTNLSFHSKYMMSNSTCQRFAWPARAARSASHS